MAILTVIMWNMIMMMIQHHGQSPHVSDILHILFICLFVFLTKRCIIKSAFIFVS